MNANEVRALEKERFGYNDGAKTALFEIAAQLAEVRLEFAAIGSELARLNANLRDIHPELNLPEECRAHTCTYYKHYLAYGGPDLTHEGFHAAEENCSMWQKRMQAWLDDPKNEGKDVPDTLDKACSTAEARVRA